MQSFILARERDASKITQYAELLGKMLAKREQLSKFKDAA